MVSCSRLLFARPLCPVAISRSGDDIGANVQCIVPLVACTCRVETIHTGWRLPGKVSHGSFDSATVLRMSLRQVLMGSASSNVFAGVRRASCTIWVVLKPNCHQRETRQKNENRSESNRPKKRRTSWIPPEASIVLNRTHALRWASRRHSSLLCPHDRLLHRFVLRYSR